MKTTSPLNHKGRPRVGIYSRVSTDDQVKEGISLENQPVLCREKLDQKFGVGGYQVVLEASDPGMSGSYGPVADDFHKETGELLVKPSRKFRPGLMRLFDAIFAGKVDVVAVCNVSRLYRDHLATSLFIRRICEERNIELVSAQENFDVRDLSGEMAAGMLGLVADFARKTGNNQVRENLQKKKAGGQALGTPPYGWRLTNALERAQGQDNEFVPILEQIEVIREMKRLLLAGYGTAAIAGILNIRGVPYESKQKRRKNKLTNEYEDAPNRPWDNIRVGLSLNNLTNAGYLELDDGSRIKGKHYEHRAFEIEEFEQIQETLAARKRGGRGASAVSPDMLLRGLLTCGACGSTLCTSVSGTRSYRCRGERGMASSRHVLVNADVVEFEVIRIIKEFAASPNVLERVRENVAKEIGHESKAAAEQLVNINSRIHKLGQDKNNALRQLREQILDEQLFKEQMAAILQDLAESEAEKERLQQLASHGNSIEASMKRAMDAAINVEACWDHLTPAERTELVRVAVKELTVFDEEHHSVLVIDSLLFGRVTVPIHQVVARAHRDSTGGGPSTLTYPELLCAIHLLNGLRTSEIAVAMDVRASTVSSLIGRLMEKLGVTSGKAAAKSIQRYLREYEPAIRKFGMHGSRRKKKDELTPIEIAVADYGQAGATDEEIASRLQMAASDVNVVRERIQRKRSA